MYRAPLRAIDAQCPGESDSAFVSRMMRELGSMFGDLWVARCASTCRSNAWPTFDPALRPPG
eukprot:6911348-Pyramimonas_sp.AAC.1